MTATRATPLAIRIEATRLRRRGSSRSSSSSTVSSLRRSLLRLRSVTAAAAGADDNSNVSPPPSPKEDAETEPVLVLPRVMMLPESVDDFDFDGGAPMVGPNSSSSPPSSSSEPSTPLPFSNFGIRDAKISRWALKSDFSGKMSVLALAVRRTFSRNYISKSYFLSSSFSQPRPSLSSLSLFSRFQT